MSDSGRTMFTAYLNQDIYSALRQYAWHENVSKSDLIGLALRQMVDRWHDDPSTVESDLAETKSDPARVVEHRTTTNQDLVKGWRGRRLLTCQAAQTPRDVVQELNADDGRNPRDSAPAPLTAAEINELTNLVNVVLRMILIANDGHISPSQLQAF